MIHAIFRQMVIACIADSDVYNSIQLLAKMDATIKQDLPPPGGYEKIQYARNPAKTYFRGISRLNFRRIVLIYLPSMYVFFMFK